MNIRLVLSQFSVLVFLISFRKAFIPSDGVMERSSCLRVYLVTILFFVQQFIILDDYKGSYYNNPQYDNPVRCAAMILSCILIDFVSDPEKIKKYPESCSANIWPGKDFPELEPAFKNLGRLIVDVGMMVARQCDKHGNKLLNPHI
jgi:hypothetical protein